MEYRRLDYLNDLNEVVALIKTNLNPNYSEEILKWKHLESPFGKSVGLVAVEENKIVGVVFAALYKFQNYSEEKFTSIRFFDACTEPDQRGKGIFKTLMNLGFEAHLNEYDFSFSNPNNASLKGHLRVGYSKPDREIFYRIGFIRPILGRINGNLKEFRPEILNDRPLAKQNLFLTGNSLKFLKWRYGGKRYMTLEYIEADQTDYIVYRIEKKNGIRAVVICDFIGDNNRINFVINKVCRKEKTILIYYLENKVNSGIRFLYSVKYKKAVVVFKTELSQVPDNLVISLGDLEGRL